MLDDFGNEMESTESKIDTTMKKVAKVLHITNGTILNFPFSSLSNIFLIFYCFPFLFFFFRQTTMDGHIYIIINPLSCCNFIFINLI